MNENRILTKSVVLILVLGLMLSIAGCNSKNKADREESQAVGSAEAPGRHYGAEIDYEYYENTASKDWVSEDSAGIVLKDESVAAPTALPENRKLIQTVRMTIETEKMDDMLATLNGKLGELSGYVEHQNIYNGSAYGGKRYRTAELTIRIPADRLSAFTDHISGVANVVSSSKSVEDVTLSYVDTESRMNALKTEETRLLELLAQAETMEDLLTIESRLTDVRTEIEQVTSTLRVYDNQVEYATVHLNISEVTEYTVVEEPPVTLWQRIRSGFRDTLRDMGEGIEEFIVFFAVNIPYIVILGVGVTALILVIRIRKKKKATKKSSEKPEEK